MTPGTDLFEMIEKQSTYFKEMIDKEMDRIMSFKEVEKFLNCSVQSVRNYSDKIGGFNPQSKIIGFRKRNVIEF